MDPLILSLLLYLKTLGIESISPQVDRPTYQFVAAEWFVKNYKRSADGMCLGGKIYLNEDRVDLRTVYGKSVLLHELVHYTQDYCPKAPDQAMWDAREHPAYQIQNTYLRDNGSPTRAILPGSNMPEYWEPIQKKTLPCGMNCVKDIPESADAIRKRFDTIDKKNKRNWHYRFEDDNILK